MTQNSIDFKIIVDLGARHDTCDKKCCKQSETLLSAEISHSSQPIRFEN